MSNNDELRDYRIDRLEKGQEKQNEILHQFGKSITELQTKMIIIGAGMGAVSAFAFGLIKDIIK